MSIPNYPSSDDGNVQYNLTTLPKGEIVSTIRAGVSDPAVLHGPGRFLWSSKHPVPDIGDRVRYDMGGGNSGTGTVRQYFVESGWLGLHVERDHPWTDRSGNVRHDAFVFGVDLKATDVPDKIPFDVAVRDARLTTDPVLLQILSEDPSVVVVLSVIGNMATTPDTLKSLKDHKDPEVRHAVIREMAMRNVEPWPDDYISAWHALEAIYNDAESFLNDDMDVDFNDLFASIRDTAAEVLY